MFSADTTRLPIAAFIVALATLAVFLVRKHQRQNDSMKAGAKAAGEEMIAECKRSLQSLAAFLLEDDRTEFEVCARPYSVGPWWRQKHYEALIVIKISEIDDSKKIEPLAKQVVQDYRKIPGNSTYPAQIKFVLKPK